MYDDDDGGGEDYDDDADGGNDVDDDDAMMIKIKMNQIKVTSMNLSKVISPSGK